MKPYFGSSLKDRKQQLEDSRQEWLSWLVQQCDSAGECDRCHKDSALWELPYEIEQEPEAGWMYCPSCFRKIINNHCNKG